MKQRSWMACSVVVRPDNQVVFPDNVAGVPSALMKVAARLRLS
ncbi:hypothetical protein [Roseibium sp.]